GANYVLWGGREGYDTILNTDLAREEHQLARFLAMVADHKHKIGFEGLLLIEPKPQEPATHQYDYDAATVHGFLVRHGLEDEYKLNLEANHATLAGHSFHHEVAYATSHGMLGSIDANRGDYQNGWDTDQFPNSVDELSLAVYEILKAGGFTSGGFNFDAKLRRQSVHRLPPVPPPNRGRAHPAPPPPLSPPTSAASTPWPAPCSWPRTCSSNARSRRTAIGATPAGTASSARASSGARCRSTSSSGASLPARSTRGPCRAARSCSRRWSTA